MNNKKKIETDKIICKCTYFWDRKPTGETIIGSGEKVIILNKLASVIWDNIDEKNTVSDIITISKSYDIDEENVISIMNQLYAADYVSYVSSIWQ